MQTRPYLIVSDIHLGAVPESTERAFRDFLRYAADTASGLLINGDLFDFWFEYRSVIPSTHYRVLAQLRDSIEAGLPITLIGGNHDAWGGSFLGDTVGLTVLDGPVEVEVGGLRTLVVHGDGVGAGDRAYRALSRVLRHPLTVGAFRTLHPDVGSWIARRVSTTEVKHAGNEASRDRATPIREWALSTLRERPELDLVVAGHAHEPELLDTDGRYYANSGDWLHHFTYLLLPGGGQPPELRSWQRSAP